MAPRMPLFPSPSMVIVRKAMVEGLKGENKFWRAVDVRHHRPADPAHG